MFQGCVRCWPCNKKLAEAPGVDGIIIILAHQWTRPLLGVFPLQHALHAQHDADLSLYTHHALRVCTVLHDSVQLKVICIRKQTGSIKCV